MEGDKKCSVSLHGWIKGKIRNTIAREPVRCGWTPPLKPFEFNSKTLKALFSTWAKDREDKMSRCPLNFALDLRENYEGELENFLSTQATKGEKLRVAHFTRSVIVEHTKGDTRAKPWQVLKENGTFLDNEITRLGQEIDCAEKSLEAPAELLVELLKDDNFLEHLDEFHVEYVIEKEIGRIYYAAEGGTVYQPPPDLQPKDKDGNVIDLHATKEAHWREIDHYLALLTTNLAGSGAGADFLEDLLGSKDLLSRKAFKTSLGYFKQAISIPPALGKFFHTLTEQFNNRFLKQLAEAKSAVRQFEWRSAQTMGAIVNNIETITETQIEALLEKKSESFSKALKEIGRAYEVKGSVAKGPPPVLMKLEKLSAKLTMNRWVFNSLSAMSFVLSSYELSETYKKGYSKDPAGFIKANLKFAGSAASLLGVGINESVKLFSKKYAFDAALVGKALGRVGFVAGILGGITSTMDARKANAKGNTGETVLHLLSGGLSVAGGAFALAGIGAAALPLLLAGIVIGVIIAANADTPLEEWAKLVPWGVNSDAQDHIEITRVIPLYFENVLAPKLLGISWLALSTVSSKGRGFYERPPGDRATLRIKTLNAHDCGLRVELEVLSKARSTWAFVEDDGVVVTEIGVELPPPPSGHQRYAMRVNVYLYPPGETSANPAKDEWHEDHDFIDNATGLLPDP